MRETGTKRYISPSLQAMCVQLITAVGCLAGTVLSLTMEGVGAADWVLPFTAGGSRLFLHIKLSFSKNRTDRRYPQSLVVRLSELRLDQKSKLVMIPCSRISQELCSFVHRFHLHRNGLCYSRTAGKLTAVAECERAYRVDLRRRYDDASHRIRVTWNIRASERIADD